MEGSYEIRSGGRVIGQVRVEKQGLYFRFSCRCSLSGTEMHRLAVTCGGKEEDLGVCVPMDGRFGVEKKVPCKRFGAGEPEFRLVSKQEKRESIFVPVYPEEPFAYMSKLKGAFLAHQAGQLGIILPE